MGAERGWSSEVCFEQDRRRRFMALQGVVIMLLFEKGKVIGGRRRRVRFFETEMPNVVLFNNVR